MAANKWLIRLLFSGFPNRFLFARLSRLPVLGAVVDNSLFRGDDIVYLPHDRVIEVNRVIGEGDQMFLPSAVIDRFIEESGYRVIMNWCFCRKANDCRDYPVDMGCLFLGESAKKIDPWLGRSVTKEEAREHMKKCREAGLVQLVGHNRLDAVWMNAFPDTKLMTICNCCTCCCLWKMLPDLPDRISSKVTGVPGLEVVVNDRCAGCGTCTKACFLDAISIVDGKAVISDQCRGCGRCSIQCKKGAIEIKMGDLDEAYRRVSASVDVR